MKTMKIGRIAGVFMLLLMSASAQATSQKIDVSQASKNEKIAKALASLSAEIDAMPKLEKKLESNFDRIKDLDALFSKFMANFDKASTIKVGTFRKINSKMVPLHRFETRYDPAKNAENLGFSFTLPNPSLSPPRFDKSFFSWFNGIRKNKKILDAFVTIFPIAISDKTKSSNPHLANVDRGFLAFPKIPFNIKRVLLYLDKSGNVTLAEANGIVYDFADNIKVEAPALKAPPVINKK